MRKVLWMDLSVEESTFGENCSRSSGNKTSMSISLSLESSSSPSVSFIPVDFGGNSPYHVSYLRMYSFLCFSPIIFCATKRSKSS